MLFGRSDFNCATSHVNCATLHVVVGEQERKMTSRHEKAGNTLVTLHIYRLTVPFDIWLCSIEQYTKNKNSMDS